MEAMKDAASKLAIEVEDARVLLRDVSWATYRTLRDAPAHQRLRMTYLDGALELMSPGRHHAVTAVMLARLLELFCLERDIPLFGYRDMTMRKALKKRGLEADNSYARGRNKKLPDLAIEVVVSSPLLDKLEVYRGLGVAEVWVHGKGRLRVYRLRRNRYVEVSSSILIPEVNLARLAHYAANPDQHAALIAYRAELRRKS